MKVENGLFSPPHPFDAPAQGGGARWNFWMKLTAQELEGWGYCMVKIA